MAAIAPWFRLHLPSCGPGFISQAHNLRFFQSVIELWCEKDECKHFNKNDFVELLTRNWFLKLRCHPRFNFLQCCKIGLLQRCSKLGQTMSMLILHTNSTNSMVPLNFNYSLSKQRHVECKQNVCKMRVNSSLKNWPSICSKFGRCLFVKRFLVRLTPTPLLWLLRGHQSSSNLVSANRISGLHPKVFQL